MPWTQEQCEAIFEQYWTTGAPRCPSCSAVIRTNRNPYMGGYLFNAECPRGCGGFSGKKTDDPKHGTFRDWTAAEQDKIMDDHFGGTVPRSPVDGTPLRLRETRTSQHNIVQADCPRCLQDIMKTYPRA